MLILLCLIIPRGSFNEGVSKQNLGIIYAVGAEMLLITLLILFTVATGFLATKISTGYARKTTRGDIYQSGKFFAG